MKKKVIYLLLLLAIIAWFSTSEKRATRFVERNGEDFAALADSGQSVPSAWEGKTVNIWNHEHPMYEMILGYGIGDRQYWGVYYSPDHVPLPFQNADVALSTGGEGTWLWQAEGDNHGMTKKITDEWYYFEAAF